MSYGRELDIYELNNNWKITGVLIMCLDHKKNP